MVDNIDLIKGLINFESPDDFYYLQIIQRKKENPHLGSNSQVIKNYYISSFKYLDSKYTEIKIICDTFNARAMIRLNKRSYKKVAMNTLVKLSGYIKTETYPATSSVFEKSCGESQGIKNKRWLLDLDGEIECGLVKELSNFIAQTSGLDSVDFPVIPSKNGIHMLVEPFDTRKFLIKYPTIEIHRDNPVNLYIP
jgi:hypothetical protein